MISFIDTSTGLPTSWFWDFGDGSTSTEQNPKHVYDAVGGYTVTLTVENAAGNNTTSKYGYVLVDVGSGTDYERAVPAYFSSSARSGNAPLKVTFHDESSTYTFLESWAFGDGSQQWFSVDGNVDIPTDVEHTYLEPGQYTVTLYQRNSGGTTVITKYHYINVTGLTKPVAAFTSEKVSVPKSLTIQFTDESTGNPTSWFWDFGDGTSSKEQNPTHTYSASGNYTVNLTANNDNGTDSKLSTINILKTTGPFAYITNINDGNMSVIDTATDKVVDTMNLGRNPFGVAVSPNGKRVYVSDTGNNTVLAIDTTIIKISAVIHVGFGPQGIAVTPDGNKVYVANEGSGSVHENGTVSVIDTTTNSITDTVNVSSVPRGIAATPDGKKVYLTDYYDVSVIDTANNTVSATVDVGSWPEGVAVSPDGKKVYVANSGSPTYPPSHTLSVIDTATNNFIASLKTGNGSYGVTVNPEGTKLYVTNYWENSVSVINAVDNTVIATVPVGNGPYGISITPDGKKVYVANQGSNYDPSGRTVSVINTDSNTVIDTVRVGSGPTAFGQFIEPTTVPEPVLPVADFTSNETSGYSPLSVQFNDSSENATGWSWNFGDGTYSTEQNPAHIYSSAGAYTVNLTVSNGDKTASKSLIITVLQVTDSSDGSSGSSRGSSSGSRGGGAGALNITSTEGSNHNVNNSTDRTNANGTAIKPEDNNLGVEQNNRTTTSSVEKTPEQTQSSNTSGKEGAKTPGFEMICGTVSLFAVVLYKASKKGN